MKNKSDKKQNKETVENEIFGRFPSEARDSIKNIWFLSGKLQEETGYLTEQDVEKALQNVQNRLDFNKQSDNIRFMNWKWISAAAVILMTVGIYWFLIPVKTTVPYAEIRTMTLPDGSQVELNSGTTVSYNRLYSVFHRNVYLEGEAYFSVEKSAHPFIVQTGEASVEVTGTKFNIRSWNDEPVNETEVTVTEGSVRFQIVNSPEDYVIVSRGQISRWKPGMLKPATPEEVSADRIVSWRNRNLVFNNKQLNVIFRELERRFDTIIQVDATGVGSETMTTFYANTVDVQTVIQDICQVKGLKYSEISNGYRIYR